MSYQVFTHNDPPHAGCSQSQQNFDGLAVPQPVPNDGSPSRFYKDWLSNFTSDICGDLAFSWIGLFEPELNYSGVRPVWWPQGIPWMNPRRILKKDKVTLLCCVLRGKLLEQCKAIDLEIEARNISRLPSSSGYQRTLTNILDAFQYEQTRRNEPQHRIFESRERAYSNPILPATPITQIVDVNSSSPGVYADLTSDFWVEWQSFSSQGGPLHAIAMTRCAFREGSLISLEGPTLLQCSVAQEIQKDARMGNLKLLVLNSPPPLGQSVSTLMYLAFSIRVAVSLPNGRIDTAIARGWEDISERIAEIETQDLATRSFV